MCQNSGAKVTTGSQRIFCEKLICRTLFSIKFNVHNLIIMLESKITGYNNKRLTDVLKLFDPNSVKTDVIFNKAGNISIYMLYLTEVD